MMSYQLTYITILLLLTALPVAAQAEAGAGKAACYSAIASSPDNPSTLQICSAALTEQVTAPASERAHLLSAMVWLHALNRDITASNSALRQIDADVRNDPVVLNNLGGALLLQQRYDSALAEFDQAMAIATDPKTTAMVQLNRSLALRALGRYTDAAEAYDDYLQTYQSSNTEPPGIIEPTVPVDRPVMRDDLGPLESRN